MTWEQKWEAMEALVGLWDISLTRDIYGKWFVAANGRSVGGDGLLHGVTGRGPSPQEAIEDDWRVFVEDLLDSQYIVLEQGNKPRRHVRWNGFMWKDLPVPQG